MHSFDLDCWFKQRMEGKSSRIPGSAPYGGVDLHHLAGLYQSVQDHQLNLQYGGPVHPSIHEGFVLMTSPAQRSDQIMPGARRVKRSSSHENKPSSAEDSANVHSDTEKLAFKEIPWMPVKWTEETVKLLITTVSYMDAALDRTATRKSAYLRRDDKWKLVSRVMAERGHQVSPQQCDEKFNDLNKKYKKLNDMLGRGTSCEVVENRTLLDVIDYLTEKEKDEVREILSSKQLFYEEMCSYNNRNRISLPHDPALQRSVHMALRSQLDRDDSRRSHSNHKDYAGDVYQDMEIDKSRVSDLGWSNSQAENPRAEWLQRHRIRLEERKLGIQVEFVELGKERSKWERLSKKKDRKLEKMRMKNERMRLENERMALQLKRMESGARR